jgi:hypothetical protein
MTEFAVYGKRFKDYKIFFLCFKHFAAGIVSFITKLSSGDDIPIIPVFKGSLIVTASWAYFIIILMFSDKINNKVNIVKLGTKFHLLLTFLTLQSIIVPVGIFGWSVVTKLPNPYFTSITEMSVFGVIERLEAGVVAVWILTDFVLIATFAFAALHILKLITKASDTKPFINIYSVLVFFLSLFLARSNFELKAIAVPILIPLNIFMEYILPLIVFIVGKIRRRM